MEGPTHSRSTIHPVWVSAPDVDPIFGVPLHVQFVDMPLPLVVASESERRSLGYFETLEAAVDSVTGRPRAAFAAPDAVDSAAVEPSVPLTGPVLEISARLWRNRTSFGCMASNTGDRPIQNYNVHITGPLRTLVECYSAKIEARDVVRRQRKKQAQAAQKLECYSRPIAVSRALN